MLTIKQQIERLQMSVALLNDADASMQAALGASDECYELHTKIEDVAEELEHLAVELQRQVIQEQRTAAI